MLSFSKPLQYTPMFKIQLDEKCKQPDISRFLSLKYKFCPTN